MSLKGVAILGRRHYGTPPPIAFTVPPDRQSAECAETTERAWRKTRLIGRSSEDDPQRAAFVNELKRRRNRKGRTP